MRVPLRGLGPGYLAAAKFRDEGSVYLAKQVSDRPTEAARDRPVLCRGFELPGGMSPECFADLAKLFTAYEMGSVGLAEEAAIRAFQIVSQHRG
jgi:hypothetical protein